MVERSVFRRTSALGVVFGSLSMLLLQQTATAQIPNAEADWQTRASAPGVFYVNNFDFADTAALISSNWNRSVNHPTRIQLDTTNKLTGRGAFRALIPASSNESTIAYQHSFDMPVGSQTKNTAKRTFYYQFQVYLPLYILDHRFKTVGDRSDIGHKFAIIQAPDRSFDTGEVVITNWGFRRFVTGYFFSGNGGVETMYRVFNTRPSDCRGSPDYGYQNAIDAGPQSSGGQTDATSCALFMRRYGPMHYSMAGSTNYGGGTLSAQGNPDPNAATNGAIWIPDAWNVVEVFVDDKPGSNDTVKIWHARRGDPPKLVTNATGLNLGDDPNNYTGVQLVPRLEELDVDGSRQDTYAIYDEVIASNNFIEFPGSSIVRPNAPTALSAQP